MAETRTTCRSCGSTSLRLVLALGDMPLADGLAYEEDLRRGETRHPLNVVFCGACCLLQIRETVPPEVLYGRDYPYYSSFSETLLRHSRENALRLIETRNLGSQSLVVELASNDGYLLKNFVEQGVGVIGIDPAKGPARAAQDAGIPTLCAYFGRNLAESLRRDGVRADVIIANNVLAHVADLNGFVAGIALLLRDDGVAVIEVPYVKDLIDHCEFDTIYHEHHCYFSVSSLTTLFARHGLVLHDAEHLRIHGGSLRLYVGRTTGVTDAVREFLGSEAEAGLTDFAYYEDFAARVTDVKERLLALLSSLKGAGKRIAAYGAAAKGATLLNFSGADSNVIDFVVDRNIHKQGRFMPGVRIPIRDPAELIASMPDFALILAWNFKEEIMSQQAEYARRGGRWIVPIPRPSIVGV